MGFLGIDTSNYTTSAAFLKNDGEMVQVKAPLPVLEGSVGLRQNDAVFAHVKMLGSLLERLFADSSEQVDAIGVSVSPRDETGSYMPCFLTGKMCAQSLAAVLHTGLYEFSHQAGHIAAVIFDTELSNLFEQEFIAFHVSGGTTQCLLVRPDKTGVKPFEITTVAESLDLHAGQVIDRAGAMLGLKFPSGAALEQLARESQTDYPVKVAFKGMSCCLSGIENQCRDLLDKNVKPCDVARFCLKSVEWAVLEMTRRVLDVYPDRTLVYAGGVMGNAMIRDSVTRSFSAQCGGVYFASPDFSADNAAGIAALCGRAYRRKGGESE